ncbi:MAG: hypothetical protein R3C40_02590 [Parvularculaceae bacterium]
MKNHLLGALAAISLFAMPAFAQNTMLQAPPAVSETISIDAVKGLFAQNGWTTQDAGTTPTHTYVQATAPNGAGEVYLAFGKCDAGECGLMETIGYFDLNSMTLAQANEFHRDKSVASMLVFIDDAIALTRKTYSAGGVTLDFISNQIGFFLYDLDLVGKSFSPGVIASVSYPEGDAPGAGSRAAAPAKILNFLRNSVGPGGADFASAAWGAVDPQ